MNKNKCQSIEQVTDQESLVVCQSSREVLSQLKQARQVTLLSFTIPSTFVSSLGKFFLMFFVSHSFVQEDIKVCLSSFKSFNIIVSSCVLKFFLHQTGLSLTMVLFNVSNEPAVSLK